MRNCIQPHRAGFAFFVVILFAAALPTNRLYYEIQGQEALRKFERVDTSYLRLIEKENLPPCIVPGPWACEDLPSYYWAANTQLKARIDDSQRIYQEKSSSRPYRAITLVAGAAGIGKSFIKGDVFNRVDLASVTYSFDIKKLYDQWCKQGMVCENPDLCCQSTVLNTLMSVEKTHGNSLLEHLIQKDASFYVIDSLDEIHPDDYLSVLRQIEQFVFRGKKDFVHVVVFGRPFAFRDYWRGEGPRSEGDDTQMYLLNPPNFRTTGDLQVSTWNYHSWRYKLAWTPNGGTEGNSAMPLQAYTEWTRLGFDRSGDFQTVSYTSDDDMTPDVHATLTQWSRTQPIAASLLSNLAANSILREIATEFASHGRPYDERAVMDAYFDAWLRRGTDSDNRPSSAKPECLDLYVRLLESVAVKYLVAGQVDRQGRFVVRDGDVVDVAHGNSRESFPVRRILDRSGLVCLDPFDPGPARYQFEPLWLHRLLVESHNERSALDEVQSASKHTSKN